MIFRADYKKTPEGFESVRIHRSYHGKPPPGEEPEKIELVGYKSDRPEVFAFVPSDIRDLRGASHRLESGMVITAEPELYPEESPVKLAWEEWNFLV